MKLSDIAKIIWEHKYTYEFGSSDIWPEDIFQKAWFDTMYPGEWIPRNSRSGWYWFLLDMDPNELKILERPEGLPAKACNIALLSESNDKLFGSELVHRNSKISVIYNGHEANVFGRIRSHYSLNNEKTGALGIKSYSILSSRKWRVCIFCEEHLKKLKHIDDETKQCIMRFCNSKTGRASIEQAWRAIYGWPILCKQ